MAVQLDENFCKGCGCCTDVCFEGAMELASGRVVVHEDYCIECGECMGMCPSAALSLGADSTADTPPRNHRDSISQ